jgi:hypothetical protein
MVGSETAVAMMQLPARFHTVRRAVYGAVRRYQESEAAGERRGEGAT